MKKIQGEDQDEAFCALELLADVSRENMKQVQSLNSVTAVTITAGTYTYNGYFMSLL